MSALYLVAIFLLVAPARPDDSCLDRYTLTLKTYKTLDSGNLQDMRTYLRLSQEARTCNGAVPDSLLFNLLSREIFAFVTLGAYREALLSLDVLGDKLLASPPETHADSMRVSWYYSTKGYTHYFFNDLNKAAGAYSNALAFESEPVQHAKYLLGFGSVLLRMQDLSEALNLFTQSSQVLNTLSFRDAKWREVYSRALFAQADVLLELYNQRGSPTGRNPFSAKEDLIEEAILLLNESLALRHNVSGGRIIEVLLELGYAYSLLEEPNEALSYLRAAHTAALRVNEAHWRYQTQYALGKFYLQTGNLDKAEVALQAAFSRINDARHGDYKRLSLNALGLLYELKRDWVRADYFYQQAIDTTEAYYASLRTTDWAVQVSGARYLPYRGKVRALLAQERYEDAFLQLAYSRARHLQDLQLQSKLVEDLSPLEHTLYDSLQMAQNSTLNALATDTLSAAERSLFKAQEANLAAQLSVLQHPSQALLTPSIADLQQALQPNQVLVSYFIGEQDVEGIPLPAPTRSYAFVLDADSLRFFPLHTSSPDLIAQIQEVSPALADGQDILSFDARFFSLPALKNLYDLLYAPLAAAIPADARLVVIPDGPLFLLPFNMLVEDLSESDDHRTAAYLVRKHAISVDLAATLLIDQSGLPPVFAYDLGAFGKSNFSDIKQTPALRAVSLSADALPSLAGVEREIEHIGSLFRRKAVRLNTAADESAFSALASQSSIVHIASHTLLNGNAPLQNAIILSSATDRQEDGFLYLHEIQRMRLPTRLVVLSGCNTSRGVHYPGEGRAGLQYAFRAAGVPSTLATSWFVDDEASATLMVAFYRHLQRGLPKDVALQQAQLMYLELAPDMATSPFFWAAPVLYGDASPLDLEPAHLIWTLLLSLLVAVALLFLGWRYAVYKRAST